ncbi:MAG: DUF429 domain-containing protein [Saprospiraceae bacterium]|nr:DUF429 domain-containing protein [Saprospiraceae bacterium]
MIAGIDYGAKLAGTPVVAWMQDGRIQFASCLKGKDADAFIFSWTLQHRPQKVFIDAPLSLPGKYSGLAGCSDYFYRDADKQLQAMSPMFLGGLTARAMQLAARLREEGVDVVETYPAYLSRLLSLNELGYKKEKNAIGGVARVLSAQFSFAIPDLPDWHHIDALLALLSGLRHACGGALSFGRVEEGVIVV